MTQNDTTNYPITGGIHPNSPAFPAEMNPEIQQIKQENQKLEQALAEKTLKIEFLQQLCEEKESKFQQLLEVHKLIVTK